MKLSAVLVLAFVGVATACDTLFGPCSMQLDELPGADVVNALYFADKTCFTLVPANDGLFFQLGDSNYTEGVEFTHCNEPGGCTCQSFKPCDYVNETEACSCFQPYECHDSLGLKRCFRPKDCQARPLREEIQINFNQPIPEVDTECESTFISKFMKQLSDCIPQCKFASAEDVVIMNEGQSLILPVRNPEDVAAIQECIDSRYIGVFEIFAQSYGDLPEEEVSSTMVASTDFDSTVFESSTFEPSTFEPSSTFVPSSAPF